MDLTLAMKRQVIDMIQQHLAEELAGLAGPGGEVTAENAPRATEVQRLLLMYRLLPLRDFSGEGEVVCPASLVELEVNAKRTLCFVAPQGGGLITKVDGRPVQVVTLNSPLGEAIAGKRSGESAVVPMSQGAREYRIISLV